MLDKVLSIVGVDKLSSKDSQGTRVRICVSNSESFEANLGPHYDEQVTMYGRVKTYPAWELLNCEVPAARIICPASIQFECAQKGLPFQARLVSENHTDISVGVCFLS